MKKWFFILLLFNFSCIDSEYFFGLTYKDALIEKFAYGGKYVPVKNLKFKKGERVFLGIYEVSGFISDKNDKCNIGMSICIKSPNNKIVFENENVYRKKAYLKLKNNTLKTSKAFFDSDKNMKSGEYTFEVIIFDKISLNELYISKKFILK